MKNNIYPTNPYNMYYSNQDRYLGGFFGPFILGGITGGLLAPAFYRPYPPQYGPTQYGPTQYGPTQYGPPCYGPNCFR